MGKVYVIRKEGTQPGFNPTAGIVAGGNGAQVMLTPGGGNRPDAASFGPAQFDDKNEQISGTGEYGPQGSYQNRLAQFGDKYGYLARYGLAGAGAINSFYNTTASGEPGALSAGAMGGYTGWLGSGGTERGAANLGSRFGARLDRRNTTGEISEQDEEGEEVGTDGDNPITSALDSLRSNKVVEPNKQTTLNDFKNNNNGYDIKDLRGY